MFLPGTALFTLASLACAVSAGRGLLVAARAVQGIGGAVISPASLAILTTSFAEGRERNRALGFWGAIGGIGAASGALLGGLLTQGLGWQWVFLVNVPVAAGILAAARGSCRRAAPSSDTATSTWPARCSRPAGFIALVFGIVRTDTLGWGALGRARPDRGSAWPCSRRSRSRGARRRGAADAAVDLLAAALRAANAVVLALYSGVFVMWFFLSLYAQQVLGFDAIPTGLAFVPMTLAVALASSRAPRIAARIGARWTLARHAARGAGLLLLTGITPGRRATSAVLPGGVLAAAGLGLALVPATIVAVQGVPTAEAGLASGLLNTSRLLGGALGLAVLTTIASSTRTRSCWPA